MSFFYAGSHLWITLSIAAIVAFLLSFVVSNEEPWQHSNFLKVLAGWLVVLMLAFHFIFGVN